jgi:hypothetical protein
VSFNVESNYFAISTLQQAYYTTSDYELMQCKGGKIKICPANRSIRSTKFNTCVLSLYLQSSDVREVCSRMMVQTPQPKLERHGSVVLYYLPELRQTFFRCHHRQGWKTTSLILHGAGTLSDTQSCHITSEALQLFGELSGEMELEVRVPLMIAPSHPTVMSASELEELKMSEAKEIGELVSNITAPNMETDVSTLIKLHPSTLPHTNSLDLTTPALITVAVTLVLIILYHFPTPVRVKS